MVWFIILVKIRIFRTFLSRQNEKKEQGELTVSSLLLYCAKRGRIPQGSLKTEVRGLLFPFQRLMPQAVKIAISKNTAHLLFAAMEDCLRYGAMRVIELFDADAVLHFQGNHYDVVLLRAGVRLRADLHPERMGIEPLRHRKVLLNTIVTGFGFQQLHIGAATLGCYARIDHAAKNIAAGQT